MTTCVLTIDFINEICHVDGKLSAYAARVVANKTIERANTVTEHFRKSNALIGHVKVGFNSHYKEASKKSPMFGKAKEYGVLALNNWATDFCDNLSVKENEFMITKHRVSPFYGTDLDLILRENDIINLILCGVGTNQAVELAAREAHDRGYVVTIISDACQCLNDYEQEASLNFLKKIATVVTAKEYTSS